MGSITINRGELTSIPFTITDSGGQLLGKRVSWSLAEYYGGSRILKKASAIPGSSSDITITTQTAGSIVGKINLLIVDYAILIRATYYSTLWIDSNTSDDRVCSSDVVTIA